VLGARLAERLGAGLGDRIVMTGTTPDGDVTRALFHLTGTLATGTRELDEIVGYTTLQAAQRALGMSDQITQIGVLAAPGVAAEGLAPRIERALAASDITHRALEVLTWREAIPEMVALLEIDDAFDLIILAAIYVIVLFSITNTFLMAVMERVREFGLLNALGMRGTRVGRLLLGETVLMTALALTIGLGIGLAGHFAVARWGIDLARYGLDEMEMSGVDLSKLVMYSVINPAKWALAAVIVGLATIASALYPAWRAARLAPAEAMRFYE
jgi:ABC-type lipoprotein release transport system permease subunit